MHDRGLYNEEADQLWLKRSDVLGRVKGFLPYIGLLTIILTDYPFLKFIVVGIMAIFVIIGKD